MTSSFALAVLTSLVMMADSGVVLGSIDLLSRRRMRSRSVTMPLTCIASSTTTTEPIFLSDIVLTAVGIMSSGRKANGAGLLLYSGRSLILIGYLLFRCRHNVLFRSSIASAALTASAAVMLLVKRC